MTVFKQKKEINDGKKQILYGIHFEKQRIMPNDTLKTVKMNDISRKTNLTSKIRCIYGDIYSKTKKVKFRHEDKKNGNTVQYSL